MNGIESIAWSKLQHAYGSAGDIPAKLQAIVIFPAEDDWKAEPWFSLWSALCHQGDVYSASVVAVSSIVSHLASAPDKATLSYYLLPVSIAIADNHSPVQVSDEDRRNFTAAVASLGSIAATQREFITDRNIAKAAEAAVLVANGCYDDAESLLEFDG